MRQQKDTRQRSHPHVPTDVSDLMKRVLRIWHHFPGGRSSFRKSITLYELSLHHAMPGISTPWSWHVLLCVGTMPPGQVARTPFARATQWASDSCSKSWSQPRSASSPRRMKEVRHCHSQIRGHLGKTEQCRNQRNIKAEKKEYTSIPLSELATHTQSEDNSYTMWVTQSPYYF